MGQEDQQPGEVVLSQFNDEAVLDKETGRVWEQSPSTALRDWFSAQAHCSDKVVGNRKGWRLPTIQELASLVDPNNPGGNPDLPPGHPFDVQSSSYWSATTFAGNTSIARAVRLSDGGGTTFNKTDDDSVLVWCVRGGQGVDPQ